MAGVYILRGSTVVLAPRLAQHRRGHTYTTRRLGELEVVAAKEVGTLSETRKIERALKAKKNSQVAIFHLQQR